MSDKILRLNATKPDIAAIALRGSALVCIEWFTAEAGTSHRIVGSPFESIPVKVVHAAYYVTWTASRAH
jgi:hypothetical protein